MRDSKKKKKEKGASETEGRKEEGKKSREAVACSSEIIVATRVVFVAIFILHDFESGVRFSTAKLRSRRLRQVFRQQSLCPTIVCYSST